MTNHDDLHDIEARLRTALQERAGDVDTTPALYQRVQEQATRGAWLRRGFALAATAAAVTGAVLVGPALLPDPTPIDITDTPDGVGPSTDPTPGTDATPTTVLPDALLEADVAVVDAAGAVTVAGRTVAGPTAAVSLAVSPGWTPAAGQVAAVLSDGSIGVVDQAGDGGASFDRLVDAAANGRGVVFSPDGIAIAWLEGTDLHVLPLSSGPGGERVLPLEGDVPDDLRLEQWFAGADAQLLLASDPVGGIWRLPMDDSDAFNSAPTDPASRLPAGADPDAVDAALLPDLSIAVLRVPSDGVPTLTLGGLPVEAPEVRSRDTELAVTGASLTLHDPSTGVGSRRDADEDSIDVVAAWETTGVLAVAPLPRLAATDTSEPDVSALGTDLVVANTDGSSTTLPVLSGPEVEAVLGLLDVRPGGTRDDFLVAYENLAEGESSIRFLQVTDDEVTRLDGVVVVGQQGEQLTSLSWAADGASIVWRSDDGTTGSVPVRRAADGSLVVGAGTGADGIASG